MYLDTLETIIENIKWATDIAEQAMNTLNNIIEVILPWIALATFIGYDIYYYIKNKKKRDVFSQEMVLGFAEAMLMILFWILPYLLFLLTGLPKIQVEFRWLMVIVITLSIAYIYGHEHGERRWLYSAIAHLGILLLGWFINEWVGILFFSLPLILAYYSTLYILAMVIFPTSNPEDKKEKRKRFIILVSYTWGIQFPILVVEDHAWKKPEIRIAGDFTRDLPIPGLVWMKSHHVAGITNGVQFNRVDGPGLVFTGKLERPLQIIDLRLQLRTNEIDVVTKDGIYFIVRVFTAFRIDPDTWEDKTYAKLRSLNPTLRGAKEPSYTTGSFPFSHRRVQAALGTTTAEPGKEIPWDQWALRIVNEEARKVVSQKTLDEFWRPLDDEKGSNAMSSIAKEISDGAALILRSKGILLLVSRIVNFRFPPNGEDKMDEISKQQIKTWGAEWERKRSQKLAGAEADAERNQQEARVYAEALLLNTIAEALQKTRDINPDLPSRVIAIRYLSALQDYAHKNTPDEEEKIKEWHNSLREQ